MPREWDQYHNRPQRRQHRCKRAPGGRAHAASLALPLSFLFLGLGFADILPGDRRRALHDVIGTAVVYSRDVRAARLRFLSRGLISSRVLPVPVLHPAWSGG